MKCKQHIIAFIADFVKIASMCRYFFSSEIYVRARVCLCVWGWLAEIRARSETSSNGWKRGRKKGTELRLQTNKFRRYVGPRHRPRTKQKYLPLEINRACVVVCYRSFRRDAFGRSVSLWPKVVNVQFMKSSRATWNEIQRTSCKFKFFKFNLTFCENTCMQRLLLLIFNIILL